MVKILIVGFGSIGRTHLENLLQFKNVNVIIYTKRTDLNSFVEQGVKISDSLTKCLEENPEIAIITNETSLHVPIAIKLAEKGLDLFIEKPLSHSVKDIKKLQTIVKKKKLITQIGCNLRFHPCIKKIKDLIEKENIGRILSAQVENCSYLPDSHRWEDYKKSFSARKELGGGVILTLIHEIDYMYWFFNEVENVVSISEKLSDLDISVEDFSASILKFSNNVIGEVHLDYFQKPNFKSCKIRGTKGEIYWDSDKNCINIYNIKKNKWETKFETGFSNNIDMYTSYVEEMKHFLRCVRQRKETINNLEQGVTTLKIALAIKKAAQTRKSVNV